MLTDLLEADFDKLPDSLRCLHSGAGCRRARGSGSVRHANRLLARLTGFPPEGDDIPLELEVTSGENREVWVRHFGDCVRRSVLSCSCGMLVEVLGPFRVEFRLSAGSDGLRFRSTRVRLWRLPVPVRIDAMEQACEGGWVFEVVVSALGSYRGRMELLT